tara:strand:+ start:822 stop:1748 length:927 start_codon:yes stop_codon:yes gene_type:complete
MKEQTIKFIDLFAGIGGFHLAFHQLGAECVFASEIDPHARLTYEKNFSPISPKLFENGHFNDDITKIANPDIEIPDFDVLCAGFPCQPFSQAGYKRGFGEKKDKRGNMFFTIASIIAAKKPKAIFLENVRHLKNHDDGKTFDIIKEIITRDLGYTFYWQIVHASDYGLPQHRPRIFMVGFREEDDKDQQFRFPEKQELKFNMSDVWGGKCNKEIGYTLRVGGRGSGLHDRRNWDHYLVDGVDRRLTSVEGKKMMGFPDDFVMPVSETQAMKQLGNSVAVDAVKAHAESIMGYLEDLNAEWVEELKAAV